MSIVDIVDLEPSQPYAVEAYDTQLMASDALAVLDAVGVERAHVWGSREPWVAILATLPE